MNTLLAWLLFGVALAWSFLVGLLAGVGAAVVARRSTDTLNILVAVLFMFGGALVLAARLVPASYLILGIFGFGAGILLALPPPKPGRPAGSVPRSCRPMPATLPPMFWSRSA